MRLVKMQLYFLKLIFPAFSRYRRSFWPWPAWWPPPSPSPCPTTPTTSPSTTDMTTERLAESRFRYEQLRNKIAPDKTLLHLHFNILHVGTGVLNQSISYLHTFSLLLIGQEKKPSSQSKCWKHNKKSVDLQLVCKCLKFCSNMLKNEE